MATKEAGSVPVGVATTLQAAYDEQYSDAMTRWREIGGKYKADNIRRVCRGHHFTKVLDCGAGDGSILKFLDGTFSELHAVEISDSAIAQIEKRNLRSLRQVKKFDGYRIPYPDHTFDMAYCSHVVEHVEHPRMLLRELARVSKHQVFEIPLDYSPGADRMVDHYLAYGHINIFTPATFKFLVKSEGYQVLDELLTHTADDVARYNWYQNQHLPKTLRRELSLRVQPIIRLLHQLRHGRGIHQEIAYAAFTCLAKCTGELKVF